MKAVQEGKSIGAAANLMRAVKAMGGGHETADLYGFDDSAMKEAEQADRDFAGYGSGWSKRRSSATLGNLVTLLLVIYACVA
jgi:hypothetical protein